MLEIKTTYTSRPPMRSSIHFTFLLDDGSVAQLSPRAALAQEPHKVLDSFLEAMDWIDTAPGWAAAYALMRCMREGPGFAGYVAPFCRSEKSRGGYARDAPSLHAASRVGSGKGFERLRVDIRSVREELGAHPERLAARQLILARE